MLGLRSLRELVPPYVLRATILMTFAPTIDARAVQSALQDLRACGGRLDEIIRTQAPADDRRKSQFQAELARAHQELAAARRRISELEQAAVVAPIHKPGADELAAELAQNRRELEVLIERSARVAEDAARQRRQAAAERSELEAELKALRKLLAQTAEPAAHAPPSRDAGSARPARLHPVPIHQDLPQSQPAGTDPVLDAVVARFDQLKREKVQPARIA